MRVWRRSPVQRFLRCDWRALVLFGYCVSMLIGRAALASTAVAQDSNTAPPEIVLLGHATLPLGLAAQTLKESGELEVHVNTDVDSADLVLFFIHAPDGPMQSGMDEIRRCEGQTLERAAILISSADLPAPELLDLVMLETREALGRYLGEEQASRLEILKMPDPDLVTKVKVLLLLPATNVRIKVPDP